MKSGEDNLQKACIRYARLQYPAILIFHVPNGGKRNAREAVKLKDMGVLPGVSDILAIEPNLLYNGFACELKFGKNKPTDSQIEFMDKLVARGWYVCVCYFIDEFIEEIDRYAKIAAKDRKPEIIQLYGKLLNN